MGGWPSGCVGRWVDGYVGGWPSGWVVEWMCYGLCVVCLDAVESHVVPVIVILAAAKSPDDFRADAILASSLYQHCHNFMT